ncbi:MFS transporter [Actinoallomurus bryophytorum]|uniref:MFS transporter n=1 Tax=Actinoallomurus bryophytorum TaxID=1490222 RepID=UPI001150DEE4|nr:MFS transporter [Actinoallomurus bryophytorum]
MTSPGRPTFREVFAVREFRALWAAELLSQLGDQLARVSLAVLVYQRTSSALLTGLTYALTYLPSLLGGVLLGGLADRYARREVIVTVDLLRAVLVGLMAVPGAPFPALCLLLVGMTTLSGPFKAAQLALLADVLSGDRYVLGLSVRHMTIQSAQVAGFLAGGVLTQAVGPSSGLGLDALSFAASAALVGFGVRRRHAPAPSTASGATRSTAGGPALVWRHPGLRSLTGLAWLAGCYIAPEGLAAPYADAVGAGTAVAVGVIMASDPVGSVIGALVFGRFVSDETRERALAPLALLAGLPLVLCVFRPGLVVSALLFAVSGALATGYHMQLGASFVRLLPASAKAQGLGVMSSGLITVQGLGTLTGGAVAELTGTANAVALAGAGGILLGARPAWVWTRESRAARLPRPPRTRADRGFETEPREEVRQMRGRDQ